MNVWQIIVTAVIIVAIVGVLATIVFDPSKDKK